jgi:hypothetical protein
MDPTQQQSFDELTDEFRKLNQNLANQNKDQHKTVAPQAPADDPTGKAGIPPKDNKFLEATRNLHEKVIGPILAKQIAQATGPGSVGEAAAAAGAEKETATKISEMGKSVMGSNKLLEQVASTAESDLQQSAENHESSQAEKLVKEKKSAVWIAGLDDKASKQFGGMFSGLKGLFGKKEPASGPPAPEDDGMGFWGWLGMILLGFGALLLPMITGAIMGLFGIVTGLFTLPFKAFMWAGGLLGKIVMGSIKLVFKGITGIFKVGAWFGGLIGKGAGWLAGKVGGWWKGIKGGFGKLFGGGASKTASKAGAKAASKTLGKAAATAADDAVKGASKGIQTGAKAGKKAALKGAAKGVLKGAARLAGPVAALGFMAFDGISAGMEEYKKSGSLLSAAKEGTAGALSGLTFGLVSQETISGAMTAIGDGIGSVVDGAAKLVTDPIGAIGDAGSALVGGAKSLLDSATGWLFGSPHATSYIDKSGDDIHDSSTSLADSASSMLGAGKVMAKGALAAGEGLVSSAAEMVGSSDAWKKGTELAGEGLSKAKTSIFDSWANAGNTLLKMSPPLRGAKYLWDTVTGWFDDSEDEVKKATGGIVDGGALVESGNKLVGQADHILVMMSKLFSKLEDRLENADVEPTNNKKNRTGGGGEPTAGEHLAVKLYGEDSLTEEERARWDKRKGAAPESKSPSRAEAKAHAQRKLAENRKGGWLWGEFAQGWDKLKEWSSDRRKSKGKEIEDLHRQAGLVKAEDPRLKNTVKMPDNAKEQKDLIDQNSQMIAKLDKICEYQQQQLDLVDSGNKDRRTQTDSVKEAAEKDKGTTVINTNNNQAAVVPTTSGSNDLSQFRSRITNFA